MKTYLCSAGVHGSRYLGKVWAESAEQALELARDLDDGGGLCHHCAHLVEDPEISSVHVRAADDADDFAEWPAPAPDAGRVQLALRLLELVERTIKTDGEVAFDLPITGRYQVHIGVRDGACKGATLAEAVEAALEQIGDEAGDPSL